MKDSSKIRGVCAGLLSTAFAIAPLALAGGCTNGDDGVGVTQQRKEETPPPPPETALCRVTGGGQILAGDSPDSFGGNAQPFRTYIGGEWNHVTHEGEHFHGDPDFISCSTVPGAPAAPPNAPANAIFFSGMGTFDGEDGCDFSVYIEDHGEPGTSDYYSIDIACQSGASYSAGDVLLNGNLQIHAVPPGHLPAI
jgi:hypothetical protein